ncbi:MAG: alpha-L-rhamnosidase C-terminal domain-containing protein [Limisphaerales bacterium]
MKLFRSFFAQRFVTSIRAVNPHPDAIMIFRAIFFSIALATLVFPVRGALNPYSADSATLHLWHFDEQAPPSMDVRSSGIARAADEMLFCATNATGASPVVSPLSINPTNDPIYAGTSITLSAAVTGQPPFYYSWQSDGGSGGALTNISGADTNPYTFSTAGLSPGARQFDLIVSNAAGSSASGIVTFNLASASGPVALSDTVIAPSSVYAGAPVSLSASFTGSQPINYQWYFDGTAIACATNSSYLIANAQVANAGSYYLVASNTPPGLGPVTSASTAVALAVAAPPVDPALSNSVSGLFCDLLNHPELTVITTPIPTFGWDYQPYFRNDRQTGYRIIVASSAALAEAGIGDTWDSGWVLSSNSINVPYAGRELQPDSSYFWRVQTANHSNQMGSLSAVQQFNTASELSNPLTTSGVIYQQPGAGSANCYPLTYVPASPVLVTNTAPGTWFIDFGQDAFGYATVHANGAFGGAVVQAGFGEMNNGDAVDTSPPGTVRYGASTFTLQNGDSIYSVHPPNFNGKPDKQFINPPSTFGTVIPFRYLELTNFPGTLTVTDVAQERLMTEFDTNAACFHSSSLALNQIWNLCRNSMEWLAFDGIYVDGDRERTPYEADTFIHQLSSYAVDNDFTLPRCSFEYLTTHPTWPKEWKFHMIMSAWADYLQTGDATLLDKYYSVLQTDSFTWAATGDGLMRGFPGFPQKTNSDVVDWPAADRDGFIISSGGYRNWTNSVNNAFYYHCLQIMANIADVTGHSNDAATYASDAAQVYSAYNSTFWDAQSQCYVDGVGTTHAAAHANFFPLAFGLVPATNREAVVNYLHSRIAADGGMPPSVYGAQYLVEALFEADDADTALDLMTTNGPRGWMNMINIGSTLTDEAWSLADKSNEDWNHAWGAAAGNLIARYVLGLQPLAPGYGRILIQPHLGRTLSTVQGVIPTIRGPVSICVSNAPGQFHLLVDIPGNVIATVMLPAFGATHPVALLDGRIVPGVLSNDWLTVPGIGSGQHAIWLSTNAAVSSAMLYENWASSWFGTNADNATVSAPTANPDGNGYDNYYDFVTGTDPTNPNAHFLMNFLVNSSNNLLIGVCGVAGRSYVLRRTLNLSPAAWTGIMTNANLSANQTLWFSDPGPCSETAFYRVLVTMP